MGVWDMMYLVQQYKKALRLAENQNFSEKTRSEYILKAEDFRLQIARNLKRVEQELEVQALLNRVD